MKRIFFSVGEASGDLHAARVAALLSGFECTGIAGDKMIEAGVIPIRHIRDTAIMGFIEVILNYSKIKKIFNEIVSTLKTNKPDLLVLVDYPGFNLRLAAEAKKLKIPVLYYIAPKVWASREGRIKKMASQIDQLAVIFPFEEAYFREAGINTVFVGNPVAEAGYAPFDESSFRLARSLPEKSRILGLLPGSRRTEVKHILPAMVGAAKLLMAEGRFDQCLVSRARAIPDEDFESLASDNRFIVVRGDPLPVFSLSNFMFVKSGTATLEAALREKPFIVTYRLSALSIFIMRRFLKIQDVSMANIAAGKRITPELIQEEATAENLANETRQILDHPKTLNNMLMEFRHLKENLSTRSASQQVAQLIKDMTNG